MIESYRPTGDYIDDVIITTSLYETFYELHDHVSDPKPFGLVRHNPKEEFFRNTLYDNYLREYLNSGILERTGVTFEEAMELPYPRFKALFRVVLETNKTYNDMVKIFIDLKVFSKTGLSLAEYSRLPYKDMNAINTVCAESMRSDNKATSSEFDKMDTRLDGMEGL